jgi:hypothetical protein
MLGNERNATGKPSPFLGRKEMATAKVFVSTTNNKCM